MQTQYLFDPIEMSINLVNKLNNSCKAFTLSEILIAALILVSVLTSAYSMLSKPSQYSVGKMDELVSHGQCKRIAMFLKEEVKKSKNLVSKFQ